MMVLHSIISVATTQCLKSTLTNYQPLKAVTASPWICMHQVRFAKRKGMRMMQEAARKKKARESGPKQKEEPKVFIPYKTILARRSTGASRRLNIDHWLKTPPVDNVWPMQYYNIKKYTFTDGFDLIRQTHHPSVYNQPNALLYLTVELDMRLPKKNKFLDSFSNIVELPHIYDNAPVNKVIAITKDEKDQVEVMNQGAVMSGFKNIIDGIKTGAITSDEYDYVLSSYDITRDILPLKGILRNKFPTLKNQMASYNLPESVAKFTKGFTLTAKKDSFEHDFGWLDMIFGQLTMTNDQLLENVKTIIDTLNTYKPPGIDWPFITRIRIMSPPSTEKYDIIIDEFIGNETSQSTAEEEKKESLASV